MMDNYSNGKMHFCHLRQSTTGTGRTGRNRKGQREGGGALKKKSICKQAFKNVTLFAVMGNNNPLSDAPACTASNAMCTPSRAVDGGGGHCNVNAADNSEQPGQCLAT